MKEIRDHYFFRAKKEGYPARSVYKLIEAQERFKFLKRGQKILDLGAAPGSWSKYCLKIVGKEGMVLAIDLHGLKLSSENLQFLKANIFEMDPVEIKEKWGEFDIILSDMAPKTSGRKDVDHYRSIELAQTALYFSKSLLKKEGVLYCKAFDGEDFPMLRKEMQALFRTVKIFKPKSSRVESVEKFLFCKGLKK